MRSILVVLALLCVSCRTASTTVVRGDLGRRIDETLTRMERFGVSGSVLVADRDGVLLSKGYGEGLRPDTIYDMGSITKTFTSAGIRMLEAEGKLSSSDKLSKYFRAAHADITLDQVLSHTAGLPDLIGDDYDPVPREEFIKRFLATPLVSKPGAEYHYSNGGYSLLSAIIEDVSGMPYETFLRERLFAPAGMRDTGYRIPAKDEHRVARTLTPPIDHGTPTARLAKAGGVHWILLGNGGMLTTTEDLYRWEKARLAPESVYTPLFKRSETASVASSWSIQQVNGERVIHHGSDAPPLGVNGEYRRYPDAGITIIFLGNTRVNGWSPRRVVGPAIRKMLRGETLKAPAVVAAADATRYAGRYTLADGNTIDIRAEGDHLVAGLTGQEAVDLFTVQHGEESLKTRRELNAKALTLGYPAVLGTSRRDRGAFMTTVRDAGGRTLRFSWARGEPVAESDDHYLPHEGIATISPIPYALERPLWRERGDTFVFYDIYADEVVRVEFSADRMRIGATEAVRSLQ